MDATRWVHSVVFFCLTAFFATGCNQQPKVLSAGDCGGQAIPQSYLVRWNGVVPAEYEMNRLHPKSLVTRFTGLTQESLEKDILGKHPSEYLFAEHDYQITNIKKEDVPTVHTNDGSGTWGIGDIHTSNAWSYLNEEGDGVTIAVIDSGIDVNHPLLSGQINGGYSFIGNPTDLSDGANHGTHVSGIIAGLGGANGFTGIAPHAKIMPLKFIDSTGAGSVSSAITATAYAVDHGAKIINASWGGSMCSASLQQEIVTATQSGTVFVNAAGNSGNNLSQAPEYPAVYQTPGKITVASYNVNEVLSTFSNYGGLVDLAAPGEYILSTVPPTDGGGEGQMGIKSGTSMATPYVAGVAALLYSARPSASAEQIANAINAGVVLGHFGVRTGGRLDALLAAQYLMSH